MKVASTSMPAGATNALGALVASTPASEHDAATDCLDVADDIDGDVYDEIETLVRDGLPRRGCIELAQALEDVIALLAPPASEFSDIALGLRPMGAGAPSR